MGEEIECSRLNSFTEDQLHAAYAMAYREARTTVGVVIGTINAQVLDTLLAVHTLQTVHGYDLVTLGLILKLSPSSSRTLVNSMLSKVCSSEEPLLCSISHVGYSLTPKGKEYVREFLSILKVCKEEFILTIEKDIADRAEKELLRARKLSAARMRKSRANKTKRG